MLFAILLQSAALLAPVSAPAQIATTPQPPSSASVATAASPGPSPLGASAVVAVNGASKAQLYSAALTWIGTAFNSAKATIDVADAAGGMIIAKPEMVFIPASRWGSACTRGVVSYVVSIAVKDGRYKYDIGSFVHTYRGHTCESAGCNYGLITSAPWSKGQSCTGFGSGEGNWLKLQSDVRTEIKTLTSSLKLAMANAAKSDW